VTLIPTTTDKPPADYTADDLEHDLLNLCRAYPTNRNPNGPDGDQCVYRSGEGMCLIGLWLEMRGHPYQQAWDCGPVEGQPVAAGAVLEDLGYCDEVFAAAGDYQQAADKGRRPWGEIFPAAVS